MRPDDSAQTAATITSGTSAGATLGSVAGPVGTVVGAGIGAVTSAIIAKKQREQREREIERVEAREDNAIQRATADSLQAGIDPRISGNQPPSAASSSVPITDVPDVGNTIADGLANAGNQITDLYKQRQQLEQNNLFKMLDAVRLQSDFNSKMESSWRELSVNYLKDAATRINTSEETARSISTNIRNKKDSLHQHIKGETNTDVKKGKVLNWLHSNGYFEKDVADYYNQHVADIGLSVGAGAGLDFGSTDEKEREQRFVNNHGELTPSSSKHTTGSGQTMHKGANATVDASAGYTDSDGSHRGDQVGSNEVTTHSSSEQLAPDHIKTVNDLTTDQLIKTVESMVSYSELKKSGTNLTEYDYPTVLKLLQQSNEASDKATEYGGKYVDYQSKLLPILQKLGF